jgi:hypothetical protein
MVFDPLKFGPSLRSSAHAPVPLTHPHEIPSFPHSGKHTEDKDNESDDPLWCEESSAGEDVFEDEAQSEADNNTAAVVALRVHFVLMLISLY